MKSIVKRGGYLNFILWMAWILFVIWVSYKCRFWLNQDAIGSIDSARSIQNVDIYNAINAYWGIGYATFLSLISFKNINSFLGVHLLVAIQILLTQIILYQALRIFNVNELLASILCIIWGLSNFASGGALFCTADTTLCLIGSIYLLIVVKSNSIDNIIKPGYAFLLGLTHGLAWYSKSIGLIGLSIFPALVLIFYLTDSIRLKLIKIGIQRSALFCLTYSLPIMLLISFWYVGCQHKYGKFTLGSSGVHVFELIVNQSKAINRAREEARHMLPHWGTIWWSDITSNLTNYDFSIHYDFKTHLQGIKRNIFTHGMEREYGLALVSLLIILVSTIYTIILVIKRRFIIYPWMLLSSISFLVFILYLITHWEARFLTFPALLAIPGLAVLLENIYSHSKKFYSKLIVTILLILTLIEGIVVTVYASTITAPGGEHFEIAKLIRTLNGDKKIGVIGAAIPNFGIYHHGFVALILNTKAAEIRQSENNKSHFIASFQPSYILYEMLPNEAPVKVIYVNHIKYKVIKSWIWRPHKINKQIILYASLKETPE